MTTVSIENTVVVINTDSTEVVVTTPVSNTSVVNSEVGPQGASAYATAVNNGFVGSEQDWVQSLMGNPRDLVVTKGIGELASLTVDFTNKIPNGSQITSIVSILSEPSLTIGAQQFTGNRISFTAGGGTLHSGHRLTMTVQITGGSTVTATIYILNI